MKNKNAISSLVSGCLFGLVLLLLTGLHPLFAGPDEIPTPPDSIPPSATDTPLPPYVYQAPASLTDGWKVGDLRKGKADLANLTKGIDQIRSGNPGHMRSLLVVRHGVLWLEEYFNGQKPEGTQPLYSCTKSVFSTVYGIAQDQGLLTLGQKISDFYPGWNPAFKDGSSAKDPITVGMLLSMTSGLDCNDIGVGSDNCGSAMGQTSDWVSFALALPLAHPPGKVWTYNGCCLTLLSQVIAQKSGMSFPDFANQRLLQPLGIADKDWVTGPKGENRVDYGLYWKARDWAKLGQLYLNKGLWEGKRIVSEAWVKDATTVHAPEGEAFGHDYGYLWHLKTLHWKGKPVRVFYANGYKGQEIYVSPDADLVCVLTADSDSTLIYAAGDRFFEDAILGSFK